MSFIVEERRKGGGRQNVNREQIEIAIIAAPEDDKYRQQVITALQGALQFFEKKDLVSIWHKGLIRSGSITAQEIQKHIQAARIILVLMSQELLADSFYNDKNNHIDVIIQRSKQKNVQVIPVLIRPCSWKDSPFKGLNPLPANEIPLLESPRRYRTLQDIAQSVKTHVEEMMETLPAEAPSRPSREPAQEKLAMSSSSFVHGYALLIGAGGNLPVTVDDAQRLGHVLEHSTRAAYPSAQVEILVENNATRVNILAAFDRLIQRVKHDPDATVIVYFSGHGGKFSQDGQAPAYFLIPHGYNPARRRETAISDHELTTRIEAMQARKMVVLLDCCHAGGIPLLKDVGEGFKMSSLPPELLQALSSGRGRVVVASSREGELSQTNSLGSIFTNCLLEALRGKGTVHSDNTIRILSVLSYLFEEVPPRTGNQQHPFVNNISNMDENFVLCYSQAQRKEKSDDTTRPSPSHSPASLTMYQRARLEKRRDELQSSLARYDEKIARLSQEADIETDVLRQYQYQQQLLQQLQKRTSIEEEQEAIIRQL